MSRTQAAARHTSHDVADMRYRPTREKSDDDATVSVVFPPGQLVPLFVMLTLILVVLVLAMFPPWMGP